MRIKYWLMRLLLKLYVFFCMVKAVKREQQFTKIDKVDRDIMNEYKDL